MNETIQTAGPRSARRLGGWRGYALLQPLVWLALGFVYYAIETHQVTTPRRPMDLLDALVWAGLGALLAVGLALAYDRLRLERGSRAGFAALVLAATAVGALVWFAAHHGLARSLGIAEPDRPLLELDAKGLFHGTKYRFGVLLAWHAVGWMRVQAATARRARERGHELERGLLEAQIAQLRGQLNPHFLFNSLNSALALIDENQEAAKAMLLDFSRLLRDTIDRSAEHRTTVDEELELVRRYIRIEQRRFEGDLAYEERVEPSTRACELPPFLLLPLVENAIKHGMRTSALPLRVELSAECDGHGLRLTVANTGRLGDTAAAPDARRDRPTGIRNLEERLSAELGDDGSFALSEQDGWVRARLTLPTAHAATGGEA